MRSQLNVMQLAWKLYKFTPVTIKFRYALKYAWKVCNAGAVMIEYGLLKLKSKITIPNGVFKRSNGFTHILFDSYHINLFLYQIRY